ncbi:hypothetical protein K504DRAFT_508913 [Pleomassaria siparia CBS 279.74]|uniref:Uncharacterized protein n=1 Tax=Pleomassaria siparia CBS 279.74 TaxID=1314801 RepID=A0A6G1JQX8_9PLEO|nr:hypothetical protein K504DRAFT_508913 [Pleomassaria siparia CBS 279.74]
MTMSPLTVNPSLIAKRTGTFYSLADNKVVMPTSSELWKLKPTPDRRLDDIKDSDKCHPACKKVNFA